MDTVNTTTEKETAMTTMTTTAAGLRAAADNLRECAGYLDQQADIAARAEFAAQLAEAKAETKKRVLTNRVVWKNIAVGDVVAVVNMVGTDDMNVTVEKVTRITETGPLTLKIETEWEFAFTDSKGNSFREFAFTDSKGNSFYNVGLYDMVTKIN